MSNSQTPTQQSSSASTTRGSRSSARIVAQTTVDARLDADFEEHGSSFDYSQTVALQKAANAGPYPPSRRGRSEKVTAYLQHIQKGKLIQPFGCLVALDERTMRVIALSENAPEMLASSPHAVPSSGTDHPSLSLGNDLRSFLTTPSVAALLKAASFPDVAPLNPVLVHSRSSGRPFYAILHRVTGCLVADFEPVKPAELPSSAAGALQSYKLAAKAISKLQSLPGGSMKRLCDTVVQEVFELTGYDRVMAYKFHDDDHGEVFSEVTKPGLEPYLGLHYPATDIPQAARFLFMKNKVRMICDCKAKPLRVFQDDSHPLDLTFCGSTMRAPHTCHLQYMENMNSIASLVLAVVINDDDDEAGNQEEDGSSPSRSQKKTRKRLWGLVVCHHTSPRFVPFPLRYACEFLAQVLAVHVNKELELENQTREKNILRTQTLLCDMLLRNAPLGIVTQTPNIMDLVKCDGAALLYQNRVWRLGTAPSEQQIRMIAVWLQEHHTDSTGLSTDSLTDAGFPGASSLGGSVCGMAAARISAGDVLFWFRSHTAAEIRWGGAKHEPGEEDDGRRMHPRSSFKAFLEVVRMRSLPWKDYEMDAIHSLQLILRGAFSETGTLDGGRRSGMLQKREESEMDARIGELRLEGMAELQAVTSEMVRLIETATVPILAVDVHGLVNGWNLKIADLTGLSVKNAIGRHLMHLVEESSAEAVERMLHLALQGQEEQNVEFKLKTHGAKGDEGPVILVVNACASRDVDENVVGVCFVAQDITSQKQVMDKFTRIEGDYKAIVQNPSPLIPPIFGADEFGWCSEWNPAMTKLTGYKREEVMDRMLLGEVFGTHGACCRMKNQESLVNLSVLINNAMTGQAAEQIPFGFFSRKGKHIECLLSVCKKIDADEVITGVFCFLHIASHELQRMLHVQRLSEQSTAKKLKALSYIRNEIRSPLSGIMYTRQMLNGTELDGEQERLLDTGVKCHNLLNKVLDDLDIDNVTDGCLELEMVEFSLRDVLITAMSQVMIPSRAKGIRVVQDLADDILDENLYGDSLRLQQIIGDFLLISVKFAPCGSMVEVGANLFRDRLGSSLQVANLELRITHAGRWIPEDLLSQMFGTEEEATEEGIGLFVCRKLLRLMNGDVRFVREAGKSSFIISAELASAKVKDALMLN